MEIYPIHLRKDVEEYGIKGRALVDYQHKEVTLKEGEECIVFNNSDSESWQLLTMGRYRRLKSNLPTHVTVICALLFWD